MKRSSILVLLFVCLGGFSIARGQCELNLNGTWKTVDGDYDRQMVFRFEPGSRVTVLSDDSVQPRVITTATYELENSKTSKLIWFTTATKSPVFKGGRTPMKIVAYDDTSMTCELPGTGQTRWVKTDPHRYFMILAARNGEFYDSSGPAFPILIKTVGETRVDAVGTYSEKGNAAFGKVPAEIYSGFLKEPQSDAEVMLRLEINAAQYERGLKILKTWDRRVREDALLYTNHSPLNNVLLVKAVTETLNQCGPVFSLYQLNYIHPEDWISDQYGSQFIPFFYFKELRRLNEARHVEDGVFQQALLATGSKPGQ